MGQFGQRPVLILGCGVAGLAAASTLKDDEGTPFIVLEQQDGPGGLVRTDQIGDYLFDRAGHFIHSRTSEFQSVLDKSGIEFKKFERKSAVIVDGKIVPYPLQFNLWACRTEFAAAVECELNALSDQINPDSTLHQRMLEVWGKTLVEQFFKPYVEKMWGHRLDDLPPNWGSRFVPTKDLNLVRMGLDGPVTHYGYNADFVYPESGRICDFPDALAADIHESIRFSSKVDSIDIDSKTVYLADGKHFRYSKLISTIPLNNLLRLIGQVADPSLFRHSNMLNVRVGFRGELYRDEHWFYLPDPNLAAFRVGLPTNFSHKVCPAGSFSLSLEVGLGEKLQMDSPIDEVAHQSLEYLADHGVLKCDQVELVDGHLIAPAYVAHRMPVTPFLQKLSHELESKDIHIAGRYGAWDYISLEDAYLSGKHSAENLLERHELAE